MPDAKNPFLGLDHFEHNPEITHPEFPVAFQRLSQRLSIVLEVRSVTVLRWPCGSFLLIFGRSGADPHRQQWDDSAMQDLATREGVSMPAVPRDLIREAIDLREDVALAALADTRIKTFDKKKGAYT
jgi:hypothetical protein